MGMAGSDGPGHTVLTEKEWVSRMIECEVGVSLNSDSAVVSCSRTSFTS